MFAMGTPQPFEELQALYRQEVLELIPAAGAVRVAKFPGKGRGLAAARPIAAGERLTAYPLDSFDGNVQLLGPLMVPDLSQSVEYALECSLPGLKGVTRIYADPAQASDPRFLAHVANDSVRLSLQAGEFGDTARLLAKCWCYYHLSSTQANAALVTHPRSMILAALRPIAEGEEVTVTYGPGYWICTEHPACTGVPSSFVALTQIWGEKNRPAQHRQLLETLARNKAFVAGLGCAPEALEAAAQSELVGQPEGRA